MILKQIIKYEAPHAPHLVAYYKIISSESSCCVMGKERGRKTWNAQAAFNEAYAWTPNYYTSVYTEVVKGWERERIPHLLGIPTAHDWGRWVARVSKFLGITVLQRFAPKSVKFTPTLHLDWSDYKSDDNGSLSVHFPGGFNLYVRMTDKSLYKPWRVMWYHGFKHLPGLTDCSFRTRRQAQFAAESVFIPLLSIAKGLVKVDVPQLIGLDDQMRKMAGQSE